jgi:hypothetical protein
LQFSLMVQTSLYPIVELKVQFPFIADPMSRMLQTNAVKSLMMID